MMKEESSRVAPLPVPAEKPVNPRFSSGPCTKHPDWDLNRLTPFIGRSHRSLEGKARLKRAIDLTRSVLEVPDDYRIAIVPASDTGAMEMAMWSLLGERPVTLAIWESFGLGWASDVVDQLKLKDSNVLQADYGDIIDFSTLDFSTDIIFTWNGTTSGVRLPDGSAIPTDRAGLTICDATSAAFAQNLPFEKLDVTTFSWQKVLGGEAGHGMLILSPRAVARLESYTPSWPIPKIFRLTSSGKLMEDIFTGSTINTPSMICVEDYLDSLQWAESIGGLQGLISRANSNFSVLDAWVQQSDWIDHLAVDPTTRSNTSVCLSITDNEFTNLSSSQQRDFVTSLTSLLEDNQVAFDIASYRDAPSGLRIWCGATVESSDLQILTQWLDWAFATIKLEKESKS